MTEERQGPTLGVHFREVLPYRESKKMTEEQQEGINNHKVMMFYWDQYKCQS